MSFGPRGRKRWLLLAPLGVLAVWPMLALNRLYDPDELEHLHAAWCVAQGQTPYKDFFEHHGPLTYYQLAPFVKRLGDDFDLLTVHRWLSFAWVAVGTVGVACFLRRMCGASLGWGLAWLFTFPWFLEKAIEGRPDVPAMALMIWAATWVRHGAKSGSPLAAAVAGLLMGTASLFTQKVLFLSIGLALGGAMTRRAFTKVASPQLFVGALAFALPWIAAGAFFWRADALQAFLHRTLVTPATWPTHTANADEVILARLTNEVSWAPGHLAILALAFLATIPRLLGRSRLCRGEAIPFLGLAAHLFGVPFTPAYLQYYLLAAPIAAMAIGTALPALLRVHSGLISLLIGAAFLVCCAPRMSSFGEFRSPYAVADALAALAVVVTSLLLVMAVLLRLRRMQTAFAVLVLLATFSPGIGRLVIYLQYWNPIGERQRKELREFQELTPGPVLDGFTGLGCLQSHVGYWWWFNHHSLPLMRKEGALQGVLERIRRREPAAVVYDQNIERIGGGIQMLLMEGYEPTRFYGRIVFLRRPVPPRE